MPRSGHADERPRQTVGVTTDRAEVFEQLRRVIAWEVAAQSGVARPTEEMSPLIADTVLDYFDVTLRDGADLTGLG